MSLRNVDLQLYVRYVHLLTIIDLQLREALNNARWLVLTKSICHSATLIAPNISKILT